MFCRRVVAARADPASVGKGDFTLIIERTGLIVWVNHTKQLKSLEKKGTIHYVSKRLKYVVIYVNSNRLDSSIKQIQQLPFVKKVERSYRGEIKTEYTKQLPEEHGMWDPQ